MTNVPRGPACRFWAAPAPAAHCHVMNAPSWNEPATWPPSLADFLESHQRRTGDATPGDDLVSAVQTHPRRDHQRTAAAGVAVAGADRQGRAGFTQTRDSGTDAWTGIRARCTVTPGTSWPWPPDAPTSSWSAAAEASRGRHRRSARSAMPCCTTPTAPWRSSLEAPGRPRAGGDEARHQRRRADFGPARADTVSLPLAGARRGRSPRRCCARRAGTAQK